MKSIKLVIKITMRKEHDDQSTTEILQQTSHNSIEINKTPITKNVALVGKLGGREHKFSERYLLYMICYLEV